MAGREIRRAGPNANANVAVIENTIVASKTGTLAPPIQTISNGSSLFIDPASRPDDQTPRTNPAPPPASASTKPSVSNCRTICRRLPPTARRIAISLRRAMPWASCMLARFRQAMISTTADMPSSIGASMAMSLSFCGFVLMESRGTGAVVKVWSFCSTGNAFSRFAARDSS